MNYRPVIESKYNRVAWEKLLYDIFKDKAKFFEAPALVEVNCNIAFNAYYIGRITLADNQCIAIYEVQLNQHVDIERNRVGIRNLLVPEWRNSGFAGAFMFCYKQSESILRFSYVSETYSFKDGKYERISTNTRRYTYVLGKGRGCRTAIDQFNTLRKSSQTLSDVTQAFSVDVLTKQFYNELFNWYSWAVAEDSGITFPNCTKVEDDDREGIETKIIRMITRIMFVWFIKQKGLVPDFLFDIKYLTNILIDFNPQDKKNGNYYNAILQNLFFATLNRAIKDENGNLRGFAHAVKKDIKTLYRYDDMFSISEQQVVRLFSEIPFLNGGLFECLDKTKTIDGVDIAFNYDGFSRNDKRFADGRFRNRAIVPNIFFFEPEKGLFPILNRYNFTIEENTPEEQQIALDPELLGKVFENLLGAYNPETKETARNLSGSFYTPREVVNYMVDESLIHYLGDNNTVRSLFREDFIYDESKSDEYQKIIRELQTVKILDPACGSGAFPMGMLNRIVGIRQKLRDPEDTYNLKLYTIENCIYGSDIQSIAVQITKLRFFISLICECERDNTKPNFGMPTLPNLETKFVSADTLLKINTPKSYNLFENPRIEETVKELKQVRHEHFQAKTAGRKIALRKRDGQLRQELAKLLTDSWTKPENAIQLVKWNPYDQNEVSSFFDPEWMFGIKDGFDIIIGNPPYIQLQNNGGALAKKYENIGYQTFARTGDIYCLFYERGWELLRKGGCLCFITSNKWMRAGYGEKIRGFFAKKTNPLILLDLSGVKIFDSTVDPNILMFSKERNTESTVCVSINKTNKDRVNNLSNLIQQQHSICSFTSSDNWAILSPIEQNIKRKIEAVGTPLKNWDIRINYGIKTGCNEAFIISTQKRDEILSNCKGEEERHRTAELIRPILRGRDIKRYEYVDNGLFLINTHNGVKGKIPRIHIEDFPAVKAHLDLYWDKIRLRTDQGDTPYNLRNCAYLEDFNKPKIIYMEIQTDNQKEGYPFPCFSYDENNMVILNTGYIMTSNSKDVLYILGVLNSSLGRFLTKLYITQLQQKQYRMLAQYVSKFPIAIPSNQEKQEIIFLVKRLLTTHSIKYQNKIDDAIFAIYRLTKDEEFFIAKKDR